MFNKNFPFLIQRPSNAHFYVSNNDGSLYLVRPLDFEKRQTYNLTVLVTNWLGQVEYVHILITVTDVNDNRPRFDRHNFATDLSLTDLTRSHSLAIMTAFDADSLDAHRLTFTTRSCFYTAKNLLISKDQAYPACRRALSVTSRSVNGSHQLLGLEIDGPGLEAYLAEASDLFLSEKASVLSFYVDVEVKDTLNTWSDVTRLNLNIYLNSSGRVVNQRGLDAVSVVAVAEETDGGDELGFRQAEYFIRVKPGEKLIAGTALIHLFGEFVWRQRDGQTRSAAPFSLKFSRVDEGNSSLHRFISVEANFGLVYLNESLVAAADQLIQLTVGCLVADRQPTRNQHLHSTAKLVVYIEASLPGTSRFLEDLVYRPIWSETHLIGHVDENSPADTWVVSSGASGLLCVRRALDEGTLGLMERHGVNSRDLVVELVGGSRQFEVEPRTGCVRCRGEVDYEKQRVWRLEVRVCQNTTAGIGCFKQVAQIDVNVVNRNDNEPSLSAR